VELVNQDGGAHLLIYQAGKAQMAGQSQTQFVFDVEDAERFCERCEKAGFAFDVLHRSNSYVFTNARDPAGNPISVSRVSQSSMNECALGLLT
jgi:hypothetical protein